MELDNRIDTGGNKISYADANSKSSLLWRKGKEIFRWCIAKAEKVIWTMNIIVSKEEIGTNAN